MCVFNKISQFMTVKEQEYPVTHCRFFNVPGAIVSNSGSITSAVLGNRLCLLRFLAAAILLRTRFFLNDRWNIKQLYSRPSTYPKP